MTFLDNKLKGLQTWKYKHKHEKTWKVRPYTSHCRVGMKSPYFPIWKNGKNMKKMKKHEKNMKKHEKHEILVKNSLDYNRVFIGSYKSEKN